MLRRLSLQVQCCGGGSVGPGPCGSSGTGGPSGAGELIASLEADAEWTWQPVRREPVRSCCIFTLSKTIGASVSVPCATRLWGSSAVALGWRRTALDTDTGQKEPHRIYNSITATSPAERTRGCCWSPHSCFKRKSLFFVSSVCCAVKRRGPAAAPEPSDPAACSRSPHVQVWRRASWPHLRPAAAALMHAWLSVAANYSPEMFSSSSHSGQSQSHQGYSGPLEPAFTFIAIKIMAHKDSAALCDLCDLCACGLGPFQFTPCCKYRTCCSC